MNLFIGIVFLVINLNNAIGDYSYLSSLNSGGHPILRAIEELSEEVEKEPHSDTSWVLTLQADIRKLVKEYGYEGATPYIQTLVEDAEKKHNVLLHVNVKRTNNNDETRRNDLKFIQPWSLKTKLIPGLRNSKDPRYLVELHDNIKTLVVNNGFEESKPLIKGLVQGTEDENGVNLFVTGDSTIYYQKDDKVEIKKLSIDSDSGFDQLVNLITDDIVSRKYLNKNDWKEDLKTYVKELVSTVDTDSLIMRLRPVVMSLEKEHKVRISDIDITSKLPLRGMDKKGDIVIKMKKVKKSKKNENNETTTPKPKTKKRSKKKKKLIKNKKSKHKKSKKQDDSETRKQLPPQPPADGPPGETSYERYLNTYNIFGPATTTEIPNKDRISADIQLYAQYLFDTYRHEIYEYKKHLNHFLREFGRQNKVIIDDFFWDESKSVAHFTLRPDPEAKTYIKPEEQTAWLRNADSKELTTTTANPEDTQKLCLPTGLLEFGLPEATIDSLVKTALDNKCPQA